MRERSRPSPSFPSFPIGPVLEHYGFDPIEPDRGWHDVRCAFHGDRRASGRVRSDESEEQVFMCNAYDTCPRGNAVQIIHAHEGLANNREGWQLAVKRAEEITGVSGGPVRGSSRSRHAVSRAPRGESPVSLFRRTWLRE